MGPVTKVTTYYSNLLKFLAVFFIYIVLEELKADFIKFYKNNKKLCICIFILMFAFFSTHQIGTILQSDLADIWPRIPRYSAMVPRETYDYAEYLGNKLSDLDPIMKDIIDRYNATGETPEGVKSFLIIRDERDLGMHHMYMRLCQTHYPPLPRIDTMTPGYSNTYYKLHEDSPGIPDLFTTKYIDNPPGIVEQAFNIYKEYRLRTGT
jgi:hypothetical protein